MPTASSLTVAPLVVSASALVLGLILAWQALARPLGNGSRIPRWLRATLALVAFATAGLAFRAGTMMPRTGATRTGTSETAAKPMPDWKLWSDRTGKSMSLAELEGKVVFLNIWATSCRPCIMELPSIEALVDRFADDDRIAFIMVCEDRDLLAVAEFLHDNGLKIPNHFEIDPPPAAFRTQGIPATFILGKDRTLKWLQLGAQDWNDDRWIAFLNELIAESFPTPVDAGAGRSEATAIPSRTE